MRWVVACSRESHNERMSRRRIALVAAAAGVAVALAGCAVAPGAEPAASAEQAPPIPATATATEPSSSPAVSPLPTWPTGPEIVASDPSEWDDLTLCLNRTLLVPDGDPLADVRRPLLELAPERIARLQLDRAAAALTVVPSAGQEVSSDDLRAAFSALADTSFDVESALTAVEVVAPEGRPFADQCTMYAHVYELMQTAVALPHDAPMVSSLGLDLDRGLVMVGVTDTDAAEFTDLAAQADLAELYYFPVSQG